MKPALGLLGMLPEAAQLAFVQFGQQANFSIGWFSPCELPEGGDNGFTYIVYFGHLVTERTRRFDKCWIVECDQCLQGRVRLLSSNNAIATRRCIERGQCWIWYRTFYQHIQTSAINCVSRVGYVGRVVDRPQPLRLIRLHALTPDLCVQPSTRCQSVIANHLRR